MRACAALCTFYSSHSSTVGSTLHILCAAGGGVLEVFPSDNSANSTHSFLGGGGAGGAAATTSSNDHPPDSTAVALAAAPPGLFRGLRVRMGVATGRLDAGVDIHNSRILELAKGNWGRDGVRGVGVGVGGGGAEVCADGMMNLPCIMGWIDMLMVMVVVAGSAGLDKLHVEVATCMSLHTGGLCLSGPTAVCINASLICCKHLPGRLSCYLACGHLSCYHDIMLVIWC